MSEQTGSDSVRQIQTSLDEISRILGEAHGLDSQTQKTLEDLVKELSKTLRSATTPSAETARLASSTAELARSLRQEQHPTLLASAKKRLEEAVLRAEAEHPVATGIAGRLLDILADLGI